MKSKVEFFGHFWEYTFSLAMLYGYAFACMPVYSHSRGEGQGPRNSTGSRGLVRDQHFTVSLVWNQVVAQATIEYCIINALMQMHEYKCLLMVKSIKKNYFKISNVSGKHLEFVFSKVTTIPLDVSSFSRCLFKKWNTFLKELFS